MDVGQAVMTFLGDTTNLDEAFARIVDEADSSMSAAAGSVDQFTDSLKGIEPVLANSRSDVDSWNEEIMRAMGEAGQGVKIFGVQTETAMAEAKVSTYEARAEVGLLGEAFGVRLPRHVRGFLAELPGVGPALTAAFSATAVFFLIDALVQGSEKLAKWISDTFIYSEAARAAYTAQVALNAKFNEAAQGISKAKDALEGYGQTATQKTQKAIEDLSGEMSKNLQQSKSNTAQIEALTKAQRETADATIYVYDEMAALDDSANKAAESIQNLRDANALLTKQMEEMNLRMKLLNLQLRDEEDAARKDSAAKQAAYQQEQINAAKTVGAATLTLLKAQAEAEVALDAGAAVRRMEINEQFAEMQYRLELSTAEKKLSAATQAENRSYAIEHANLENRIAVQKTLGAAGVEAAAATEVQIEELAKAHNLKLKTEQEKGNAEILAMQKKHDADLLQEATKAKNEIEAALQQNAAGRGLFPTLPADMRDLLSMADAAAKLGVTLATDLAKNATAAKAALAILSMELKGGVITLRDYQQAEMAALQAQIAWDKETGKAPALVAAEEKELDKLKKNFDSLYPAEQKTRTFWDSFAADFKKKSHDVGEEANQMGGLMAKAATQMDEAFASAVMGALESGKSIGKALEQATATVLKNLAEQALAHAIYCTAMGIAELALGVTDSSAAEWFAAAAEFGLVAGASGAAGIAMSGGGSSSGSGAGNSVAPSPGQTQAGTLGNTGGSQTLGVTKLAAGGIVSAPTMFMAGDSLSGGSADEAILPLSDPDAMGNVAHAFLSGLLGSPTLSDTLGFNEAPSSKSDRPSSFEFSRSSLQPETPDMSAIAAGMTGLLSAPTLRAAAGSQRFAAASQAAAVAPAGFDNASMESFADRVGDRLSGSSSSSAGATTIHNHINVKGGLLAPENIVRVVQKMNRMVNNRQLTLNSSNTMRVTRRSQ